MYDLQTQQTVIELRRKAVANTLTKEEMVAAVRLLTEGRKSAAAASTASKSTRTKAAAGAANLPSGDDLLDEMLS